MRARNQKRCSFLSKRTAPPDHRQTRGVTLLELVTCLAISAVLVGGLASSVYLSTKGLETLTSPTNTAIDTSAALNQFTADVRLATGFTERTSTAVTFTVPDRTGDGWPDTIRYAWAGAGSPLTRTVNGLPNPAATILDNVSAVELTYLTRTMQPPYSESAQQLLISYTTTYNATGPIQKTNWEGQAFRPTLPGNAVLWKITSADIYAKRNSSSGTVTVKLYAIDATNKPSGAPIASTNVDVSTWPSSYGWVSITFSPVTLSTGTGAAIAITSTNNTAQSTVTGYLGFSPPATNMFYVNSIDQGTTWTTPANNNALDFKIYGTITTMVAQ